MFHLRLNTLKDLQFLEVWVSGHYVLYTTSQSTFDHQIIIGIPADFDLASRFHKAGIASHILDHYIGLIGGQTKRLVGSRRVTINALP